MGVRSNQTSIQVCLIFTETLPHWKILVYAWKDWKETEQCIKATCIESQVGVRNDK